MDTGKLFCVDDLLFLFADRGPCFGLQGFSLQRDISYFTFARKGGSYVEALF
jgi:hypothetical protein